VGLHACAELAWGRRAGCPDWPHNAAVSLRWRRAQPLAGLLGCVGSLPQPAHGSGTHTPDHAIAKPPGGCQWAGAARPTTSRTASSPCLLASCLLTSASRSPRLTRRMNGFLLVCPLAG